MWRKSLIDYILNILIIIWKKFTSSSRPAVPRPMLTFFMPLLCKFALMYIRLFAKRPQKIQEITNNIVRLRSVHIFIPLVLIFCMQKATFSLSHCYFLRKIKHCCHKALWFSRDCSPGASRSMKQCLAYETTFWKQQYHRYSDRYWISPNQLRG